MQEPECQQILIERSWDNFLLGINKRKMKIKDLGNIPFPVSVLQAVYPDIQTLTAKAKRIEEKNDIIRLKRGIYVVSPEISGKLLNEFLIANHLYGPSYVSMQSALRFYGLIPERVYGITSMTTGLAKRYSNKIAEFTYVHCPENYYNVGVRSQQEEGMSFLIATREKALCDLMIYTPNLNLRYLSEIKSFLKEDLRFEMDELKTFDLDLLRECQKRGRKKGMISQLIKIIENERNI